MRALKAGTVLAVASIAIGALLLPGIGPAQNAPDLKQVFDKIDVMIPMRDGIRLHTEICVPKSAAEPLPFLITRTPYGVNDDEQGFSRTLGIYRELVPSGYIFVFQDIRGRFQSEGQFVMQRPPRDRGNPKSIDEGTDTYDTIDWLIKNVPQQQRARRHARHLLWRVADRHGVCSTRIPRSRPSPSRPPRPTCSSETISTTTARFA